MKNVRRSIVSIVITFILILSTITTTFAKDNVGMIWEESNETVHFSEYQLSIKTASIFRLNKEKYGVSGELAYGTYYGYFRAGKNFHLEVIPNDPNVAPHNANFDQFEPKRIGHSKIYLRGYIGKIEKHWKKINKQWVHIFVVHIAGTKSTILIVHDKKGYTIYPNGLRK